MKCIKCSAEVKSEFKICPYCGEPIQMVPDYSIYDEDDINIILEETKHVESKNNKAYMKEQKAKKEKAKRKAIEEAKKKKARNQKILIISAIIALIAAIALAVASVINMNNSSYDHQMKQASSAMFKGDLEKAESYYNKALELSPNDIKVRLELANLYVKKDDTNKALKLLDEIRKKDASNIDAYKLYYKIYSKTDDTDAIMELIEDVTDNKILAIFGDYVVNKPTLNKLSGDYTEAIELKIQAKKGLEIYYTLDGSNPKTSGEKYVDTILLEDEGEHIIKVVTKNSAGYYSNIITEIYNISFEAPEEPKVNPDGGTYTTPTYVYITVPKGCTAYYTWDGTEPTISSNVYTSPLLIPEGYHVLSVIVVNDKSNLQSAIYRGAFEYLKY